MPPFPLEAFLASLPWVIAGIVALLALTFAVAVRQHRHSVIDTVWGLGFVVVAVVSWALSTGYGDARVKSIVISALRTLGHRAGLLGRPGQLCKLVPLNPRHLGAQGER